jgi:hypothetical protein
VKIIINLLEFVMFLLNESRRVLMIKSERVDNSLNTRHKDVGRGSYNSGNYISNFYLDESLESFMIYIS